MIRQVSDNGMPVDMAYNTRFVHILFQLVPMRFLNWFGEKKLNAMYDHTMYALKPKHRYEHRIGNQYSVGGGSYNIKDWSESFHSMALLL